MAFINIKNLSLSFDIYSGKNNTLKDFILNYFSGAKQNKFEALSDICLNINSGERIGIIGKNGAGKSTLLKVISGIYSEYNGSVTTQGKIVSLLDTGAGFVPDLTGRENIFLNSALLGQTKEEIIKNFDYIVSFSGIEKFIDEPIKKYSSGMYSRLAFTIATSVNPDILILDEIFSTGDAFFLEKAEKRLEEISKKAKIILAVSHDFSHLKKYCDSLILMDSGKIIKKGSYEKVKCFYLNNK